MLAMLDWVVPPSTKASMTAVDWLLTVLAVYLHDLGMVVTEDEYTCRLSNSEYVAFLDRLQTDVDARDYLARAEHDRSRARSFLLSRVH